METIEQKVNRESLVKLCCVQLWRKFKRNYYLTWNDPSEQPFISAIMITATVIVSLFSAGFGLWCMVNWYDFVGPFWGWITIGPSLAIIILWTVFKLGN